MSEAQSRNSSRIAREKQTIRAMIEIYCRARHERARDLCVECQGLYAYALNRLERCPFGEQKTTCAKCPVHCYKPAMRTRIREVMRFAGPRMLFRHPVLAVQHLWDERRKPSRDKPSPQ